mgnify:CR=1 FL=1
MGVLVGEAVGAGMVGVNVSVGGMEVGGTAVSVGAATSSGVDVASTAGAASAGALVGADDGILQAVRSKIRAKEMTGLSFMVKPFSIQ